MYNGKARIEIREDDHNHEERAVMGAVHTLLERLFGVKSGQLFISYLWEGCRANQAGSAQRRVSVEQGF